jgi:histidinol phosphatase-like PHP family hydrolase
MLFDMHTHATPASGDSRMTVGELAAAAGRLGLDAVALTDHGPGADFDAAREALASRGVALVPGREIATDLGHVLVLSADAAWLAAHPRRCDLPLPDSRRSPAALVWAHPGGWRVGWTMVPPDPSRGAEHLHGVEILNGERLHQADGLEVAARIARELKLAACGGSDAHDVAGVGRCLTEVPGARSVEELVEAIVAGETRPVLGEAWANANQANYERTDLALYREGVTS